MKAPKNFYNTVDQKKLGIDQIEDIKKTVDSIISLPEATSSDEGKVAMVNSSGEWELNSIITLPPVTSDDNDKMLQVVNGEWNIVDLDGNNIEY